MWDYVRRGVSFEIPASLSTDDLTTRAVLCLQQKHPECPVTMLQSRVVVVGRVKSQALVSPEAMKLLEQADFFPKAEKAINHIDFIEQQKDFMMRNDVNVDAAVKRAMLEQQKRDGIELSPEDKIFIAEAEAPTEEPAVKAAAPVEVTIPAGPIDILPGAQP